MEAKLTYTLPTYPVSQQDAESFIAATEATSNVIRYHGHCVIRQQSVADHSCRVGMLAYAIALEKFNDPTVAAIAASYGIFHDACEGMVKSDVNASVKAQYGIRDLVRQVEEDGVNRAFSSDTRGGEMFKTLFLEKAPPEIYKVLRLADTLDFGLYIHTERMMGNRTILPLLESFVREFGAHPEELRELEISKAAYSKIMSV